MYIFKVTATLLVPKIPDGEEKNLDIAGDNYS